MLFINIEIRKTTLTWIILVLVLSSGAYLPMLLEQSGFPIPSELLLVKYLFLFIPLFVSIGTTKYMKKSMTYFKNLFKGRIKVEWLIILIICIIVGVVTSSLFSQTGNMDFLSYYGSIGSLIFSSIYLLCTAVIEEAAWRGFLLEQFSAKRKSISAILLCGLIWSLWHLPMWIIRNSQELKGVCLLLIWTLLISCILGVAYYKYKNILLVAGVHMIFNVCYVGRIQYNVVILLIIFTGVLLFQKFKNKTV